MKQFDPKTKRLLRHFFDYWDFKRGHNVYYDEHLVTEEELLRLLLQDIKDLLEEA